MTEQDKKKTAQILAACLKAFPSSKADEETILLYITALDELSFWQVKAALLKLLRTARFFPTVSEILEAAEDVERTAGDNELPTPAEAWEEAMSLVKTCHMYKAWMFSCPEVEKAVEQFGKESLVQLNQNEVGTARAQFRNIYKSVIEKEKAKRHNAEVLRQMGTDVGMLVSRAAGAHDMNRLIGESKGDKS